MHYEFIQREGEKVLVFLHGWGRSGEDFLPFVSLFDDYSILLIDFPPFGESEFPQPFISIFSYANMVISLCEHLDISSADFIAHSFGGRILLILAALKSSLVHKSIFCDSAGLKPRRGIKYHVKVARYKLAKRLNKKMEAGSADYRALSPSMKGLFNNIVNTHLDEFAKSVKSPSLIVWGEDDKETPTYMAKRLNKLIKSSKLVFLNGGHFAFLESRFEFFATARQFLKETQ